MSQHTNKVETSDLKELFFSLIAQWKLIALCTILSLGCALLYLRATPNTYAVSALIQVEDSKGAGTAALLGNLSSMVVDQNSPAQAEIEILKSHLVLGNVIKHLNLDLQVSGTENTFFGRLLSPHIYKTQYSTQSVLFKDNEKAFEITQFKVPENYEDQSLELRFTDHQFSLTNPKTEQVLLTAKVNQPNNIRTADGVWNITIHTQD